MADDGSRRATPINQTVQANSATRALNILGDRWTLMILYLAFQGCKRFDELQSRIGIARSLLTDRLGRLVKAGVLKRERYQARPPRYEYRLSEKGRDLWSVALAIVGWEKRWFYDARHPIHQLKHSCGKTFTPELRCGACDEVVTARDVTSRDGPGAGYESSPPPRAQRRSTLGVDELNSDAMLERAFQVLGDRWTSHVIAAAFRGKRRFNEFEELLGIASNILSDRLARLVDLGVLKRVRYQERPERWEYRLTDEGRDLYPLIVELNRWGDRWLAGKSGPPLLIVHNACGKVLAPKIVCDQCKQVVTLESVSLPKQ